MPPPGDTVTSVAVSDDDKLIAVGSTNKKATVYTTSNGAEVAAFTAKAGIEAVVISGVGEATRLLAGTFGGHVQMWHVATEMEARHGSPPRFAHLLPRPLLHLLPPHRRAPHTLTYG